LKKKKKKKFIQDAIKRPGAFTAKAEKKGITTAQQQENILLILLDLNLVT